MDKRKIKGFTLPEMMVSLAIFSLMMLLVSVILRGGEEQLRLSDHKMSLQESLRESLYRMALEVRESSPSRVSVTNGGSTLVVQIPTGVSDFGVIIWSAPITYQVGGNGKQLVRIQGGQASVLANDIQSVAFQTTGNPTGTIVFNVAAQRTLIDGRVLSLASSGEAKLRNP